MTIECCSWPYLLTKAASFVLSPVSESPPHFSQNFNSLFFKVAVAVCHKGKTPGYRLLYVDKQPFVRSQNQRRSFLTNLDFMIWPSRVRVLSAILEFGVLPLLNSGDIAKFQKWTSIVFLKLYSAKNRYISILCDVYIYIYV